ncbi:unnamed protein product [Prorocentrum cordatum]|uniref:Uncharacterized protein n=1 Tax=Prorocentrum cordatum TaxID=2364126 RepID=A0ABN9VJF8_9DINO|nr:unnamed protein product [Polarella glacialis]
MLESVCQSELTSVLPLGRATGTVGGGTACTPRMSEEKTQVEIDECWEEGGGDGARVGKGAALEPRQAMAFGHPAFVGGTPACSAPGEPIFPPLGRRWTTRPSASRPVAALPPRGLRRGRPAPRARPRPATPSPSRRRHACARTDPACARPAPVAVCFLGVAGQRPPRSLALGGSSGIGSPGRRCAHKLPPRAQRWRPT